jgi:Txe/YoeB family toxin of Txe-Axe toxin-antitoxin module
MLPFRQISKAVASDIIPELVNLWDQIKNNPEKVAHEYKARWDRLQNEGHSVFYEVCDLKRRKIIFNLRKKAMKAILVVILIFVSITAYCQLNQQERLVYKQKVSFYNELRMVGYVYSVTGLMEIAVGAYVWEMAKKQEHITDSKRNWSHGLIYSGIGNFTIGIVLYYIGDFERKKFQERINLGLIYNEEMKGLTLVYKF